MATSLEEFQSATTSKLIDFDDAEVVGGFVNDTWFLNVTGTAPCLNMEVRLQPRIYVKCPDYWEIEVTGTLSGGHCLEALRPYSVTIPLAGITGSAGVKVIGGNKTKKLEVGGGCD